MLNNLTYYDDTKSSEDSLFVFFMLGEKMYAIHTSHTVELLKMPLLEHPQSLPKHIIGVLTYNNLTINIVDMKSILDGSRQSCSIDTQLMIVSTEESIFGMVVDKIIDVVSIPAAEMKFPPYVSEDNIIKMMYQYDKNLVSIIDLYSIENVLKTNEINEDHYNYDSLFPQDSESRVVMKNRATELITKNSTEFMTGSYNEDQFIVFKLFDSSYCINMKFVREIVSLSSLNIMELPYSPDYLEGIINLRGDFISIINLKKFLGYESKGEVLIGKVLVLDSKEYKMALLVDEVIGIKNIDDDNFVHHSSGKVEAKYTMAELVENQQIYHILNVEKLLQDEKFFINIED